MSSDFGTRNRNESADREVLRIMTNPSLDTYLLAARELLLAAGQNNPAMAAQDVALLQESIELVDRTRLNIGESNE